MDDLVKRMQPVWSEIDEAGGSIDECWAGVRDLVLEEAARMVENDVCDSSIRLDPKKHKSIGDWINAQRAAAIRSLSSKGGE